MQRLTSIALAGFVFLASNTLLRFRIEAQESKIQLVRAARILDLWTSRYIENGAVLIQGDRIREAGAAADIERHISKNTEIINLGSLTLLPGLVDCHTHLMARIPDTPDGYIVNLATKSQAFRALEGAADARLTLEAGFTTVRDVENEGSGYADVALRDAIDQGLVEGPRMQVATRAIAPVEEAHKAGRKVAAHATTAEGIKNAINAGVDSIEHGHRADRDDLEMMKAKGVFWVPTLGVEDAYFAAEGERFNPDQRQRFELLFQGIQQAITQGQALGVKIAS